ncbi:GNAT family N-acetyltransferase [Pokkaliibacter sp. CJK22405]|uniref:GNAT family N-acetyltransferase n=1 Tax=Pokkaliibacter sp. CJK22405 TaxID=3384615 RepID=UPI003984D823
MSNVLIDFRPAIQEDKATLLEFEQQVIGAERPFNAAIKEKGAHYYDLDFLISDVHTELLVGEYQGEVIAVGYLQIRESKAHLQHRQHGYLGFMYVEEAFRGQGINQQLINALLEWGKSQGVKDFYLEVYSENTAAIRAYQKLGFRSLVSEMKLTLE